MLKIALVLTSCLAVALSAPQKAAEEPIAIISQFSNVEGDGSYQHSYETANGIKAQEVGTLKKTSDPKGVDSIAVQGSYTYTAPDGSVIAIEYIADDVNGFVPKGDHIPTPPPIPPAIQKALDYIASLPPAKLST